MTVTFVAFNVAMLWWFLHERHRFDACIPAGCPSALRLAFVVTSWMFGTLFLSLLWLTVEKRLGLRELSKLAQAPRTDR